MHLQMAKSDGKRQKICDLHQLELYFDSCFDFFHSNKAIYTNQMN